MSSWRQSCITALTTHAMPMNSRNEPKKPVGRTGQFLRFVLEDKAQLWWWWWWWLEPASSSTCVVHQARMVGLLGLTRPEHYPGLATFSRSAVPDWTKPGHNRGTEILWPAPVPGTVPGHWWRSVSGLLESLFENNLLCLVCSPAGARQAHYDSVVPPPAPPPALPAPPNWLCLLSSLPGHAASQAASRLCLFLH